MWTEGVEAEDRDRHWRTGKRLQLEVIKQTNSQPVRGGQSLSEDKLLGLLVVAVLRLLLAHAALVDVLQRVRPLQRQVRRADGGQRVLLRVHPRLQGRVVFPLPLRVFQRCLVDLPHGLAGQRRQDRVGQGTETPSAGGTGPTFTFGATN